MLPDYSVESKHIRAGAVNVYKLSPKTKAGTPSDADFSPAPPVGTIVIDTTANKIWVRVAAATWKSVALV